MKRAIVDLSSVIWTGLLAGKDVEFGKKVMHNDKEVLINSAAFGYDNCMNHLVKVLDDLNIPPRQFIFVMEGKNSKQNRLTLHPAYKGGRDKVPEQYVEFNLCKEMVMQAFLNVGAQVCWQDGGVEADDVIGYLAQNLDGERWCVSGDKDIAVVVDPANGINHLRNGVVNQNPFGDFPHRWINAYIALVGDSSDKIPGARGFGAKAMEMMLIAFGDDGLELMDGLIRAKELMKLEEDVVTLKELQKVIDDQDGVYMSYELARLQTEKVNTMKRPLEWRAGMVKPRPQCEDERLRKHAGVNRIVSAENYDEAMKFAANQINRSPYVSLDIETSTPQESDDWLESRDKADRVDVFGSELTSLQMTFGPNMQYTMYLPYDNVEVVGCTNLTMEQVAAFVDLVPRHMVTLIQNVAFELPVCYMSWGQMWANDPLYHGFLRNVRDTKIMSSYVDENRLSGLKQNSKLLLDYEQVSYEHATTRDELRSEWNGIGKELQTYMEPILEDTEEMEEVITGYTELVPNGTFNDDGDEGMSSKPIKNMVPKMKHIGDIEHVMVQRKMNQLTAAEVFDYGCDDTICTAAVANHYMVIMELEKSWSIFEEVETYPAYLTALSYVQGTAFSLESMAAQEKDDDAAYEKARPVLMDYLVKIGFEGTRFNKVVELTPAEIKRAVFDVTGQTLVTMVRTPSKLAKLIADIEHGSADLLSVLVSQDSIDEINALMEANFTGEPELDLASPKQMKALLYDFMGIPIKVINDITPTEKLKQPALDMAVRKFKQIRAGTSSLVMSDDEMKLMRQKAKTDDTAIDFALAFDTDVLDDDARTALKAIGVMKKVMTRRSLFYKNYWKGLHWKDRRMHANVNQCAAVTRRYSMSDQNLQQLPKKGEAVRFRGHFKPHHKLAVIASEDFIGQELRLAADVSQDKNMLACYVGEHLKDIHSITAAGALKLKWGAKLVEGLFEQYGPTLARDTEGTYELFVTIRALGKSVEVGKRADDLRKDAKNVNFGAQNGAKAVKLSETLVMLLPDAQLFLDARDRMFPDVDRTASRIADEAKRVGYATTLMGARRHLRDAMLSDERGAADRAARQAWNYKIQGSAGEMTKLAMSRLWLSNVYFKYDARFIAPIHDELVSSVHRDHAVDFLREKHWCMTQPYSTMKVPILGSISLGPDFADQTECGDDFIEANIVAALNDIFEMQEAA
jgi:5'-3' exonuclease